MVMDTGEGGPLGLVACSVEATTSPTSASAASASPSAAASASTAASAAAPGLLGLAVEALELLLGATGGGPCLDGILGGVGLHHGPHVLALLLALEDLDVGRQRRPWAIEDTPPSAVYRH